MCCGAASTLGTKDAASQSGEGDLPLSQIPGIKAMKKKILV